MSRSENEYTEKDSDAVKEMTAAYCKVTGQLGELIAVGVAMQLVFLTLRECAEMVIDEE